MQIFTTKYASGSRAQFEGIQGSLSEALNEAFNDLDNYQQDQNTTLLVFDIQSAYSTKDEVFHVVINCFFTNQDGNDFNFYSQYEKRG